MKVGYNPNNKTSITTPPSPPSTSEKYLVWHIEGGLGKNIAATSLLNDLAKKYEDRKIVVVASYPIIFLNHPAVYRAYRVGMTAYFYDDYIHNKDTLIFKHEPYFETNHILRKKHLIENWANLLGLDTPVNLTPDIHLNMVQSRLHTNWMREKPICLLQTNGGPLDTQRQGYTWTRDIPIDLAVHIAEKYRNTHHIMQVTRPGSPHIPGAEIIDIPLTPIELITLLKATDKRILIDSCLQHAAAGFGLPSVVLWIGTSSINFGYDMHTNIQALPPKGNTKLIDSYLFDYSFDGIHHECPYNNINEMFDINNLDKTLQ